MDTALGAIRFGDFLRVLGASSQAGAFAWTKGKDRSETQPNAGRSARKLRRIKTRAAGSRQTQSREAPVRWVG